MCTRYHIEKDDPTLASIIEKALNSPLAKRFQIDLSKPMITEGEVHPTDVAPVIAPAKDGKKAVFPMKWGFTVQIEGRDKPVVNARIETAPKKDLFREAWLRHRCIIPASWYIEWKHTENTIEKVSDKEKYVIQPKNDLITWMCGLYRIENGVPVFTILTKEPTPELAQIHDRMPFILPEDRIEEWIKPDNKPENLIPYSMTNMYAELA